MISSVKVEKGGRLSLAYKQLRQIPMATIGKQAHLVRELDLSHNFVTDLTHLDMLTNLETLVLDNNRLQSHLKLSPMPKLTLFWCNSNRIKHLSVFIENLAKHAPNLKFFSMLNNEACPNFFNGGTMDKYNDYRLFVISRLPNLQVLDSTPVSEEERQKAKDTYGDLSLKPMVEQADEMEKKKKQIKEMKRKKEEEEQRKKEGEEKNRIQSQMKLLRNKNATPSPNAVSQISATSSPIISPNRLPSVKNQPNQSPSSVAPIAETMDLPPVNHQSSDDDNDNDSDGFSDDE